MLADPQAFIESLDLPEPAGPPTTGGINPPEIHTRLFASGSPLGRPLQGRWRAAIAAALASCGYSLLPEVQVRGLPYTVRLPHGRAHWLCGHLFVDSRAVVGGAYDPWFLAYDLPHAAVDKPLCEAERSPGSLAVELAADCLCVRRLVPSPFMAARFDARRAARVRARLDGGDASPLLARIAACYRRDGVPDPVDPALRCLEAAEALKRRAVCLPAWPVRSAAADVRDR